jgi:co-chaperonin GroES (HSP10)
MYELKPMNKHVWLEPITQENKVGTLYIVSHSQNSFQLGRIKAFADCDETKGLNVDDVVLYDSLGSYNHRVGNQSLTTVKALNIVAIVRDTSEPKDVVELAAQVFNGVR